MVSPTNARERALAAAFVDVADTMVDEYDILDLLYRVAAHSVHLLDVDAAGLLLADGRGHLRLLASSDEQARLIELFQLQTQQEGGPCLDCYHSGQPVTAIDLAQYHQRWPGFVVEAQRQGFHTVHALPMRLREEVIGGLNLFRSKTTPLNMEDLRLGQALADIATIAILQQRALSHRELIIEQLQGALHSRITIEQAKGALAYRGNISIDAAFHRLRSYARDHRLKLSDLARRVLVDRNQAQHVLEDTHTQHGRVVAGKGRSLMSEHATWRLR
jgi:transcriptional regulator with GAF, ATPase, and Fis domain